MWSRDEVTHHAKTDDVCIDGRTRMLHIWRPEGDVHGSKSIPSLRHSLDNLPVFWSAKTAALNSGKTRR
jgi:hypothetical protein